MNLEEQTAYLKERGWEDGWETATGWHQTPEKWFDLKGNRLLTQTSDGLNPPTHRWTASVWRGSKQIPTYVVRWSDACETAVQAYVLAELRGWV